MTKKTRMFTGLVAAAMALVLLFSALYIAVEADHSCTGEDCADCRRPDGGPAPFYAPGSSAHGGVCRGFYLSRTQGETFRLSQNRTYRGEVYPVGDRLCGATVALVFCAHFSILTINLEVILFYETYHFPDVIPDHGGQPALRLR